MFKRILTDGLKNGAALTAVTTAGILVASANERDGAWGAINNVSHIIDGDDVTYGDHFSPRDSTIGFAINSTAMVTWGLLYALAFGRIQLPNSIATASIFTIGAYLVDYYIVPKQYTPGIEYKISKRAIFAIYVLIALTLCLSPRWSQRKV